MNINQKIKCSGEAQIMVLDENENVIHDTDWIPNLMTYAGVSSGHTSGTVSFQFGKASTNPSFGLFRSIIPNITASQTGDIITVTSGIDFVVEKAIVGDSMKFSNGQRAYITSIISSTSVQVSETNNVVSQGATFYHTSESFDSIQTSTNSSSYERNRDEDTVTSFTASTIFTNPYTQTNQEWEQVFSGTSNQFTGSDIIEIFCVSGTARIVLETPIQVQAGNRIFARYRTKRFLDIDNPTYYTNNAFNNLPYEIPISTGNSDGTSATFNTATKHPYIVGDQITITDSHPIAETASISSNGSIWTVTINGHGFNIGDSIVIENTTDYDGVYTVVTTTANTFTISNTNTFTTQTGDVYLEAPATYFNDTFTITSVPDEFNFEVSTTLPNTTLPTESGRVGVPNANFTHHVGSSSDFAFRQFSSAPSIGGLTFWDTDVWSGQYPEINSNSNPTSQIAGGTNLILQTSTQSTPSPTNMYTGSRNIRTATDISYDYPRIKQISWIDGTSFTSSFTQIHVITFDHIQTKFNNFDLLMTISHSFEPDLP